MELRERLLNDWQRDFPLRDDPFGAIARTLGRTRHEVLAELQAAHAEGVLQRIGGVFAPTCAGDSLLAAMCVPEPLLEAVAAKVSAHPAVNHNYAREHAINLWFVLAGPTRAAVETALREIEAETGRAALRLRLVRPYRIDLGFELGAATAVHPMRAAPHAAPPTVPPALWPLARCVEAGLPLVPHPYRTWAAYLGCTPVQVWAQLRDWLDSGVLRRFGAVVRHHELGYVANAMVVWDVPDDVVDAAGMALAQQPGLTLVYRRQRAAGWPYNLYAMVHGKTRAAVVAVLRAAMAAAGVSPYPRQILFTRRRYKQTAARRFRGWNGVSPALPGVVASCA